MSNETFLLTNYCDVKKHILKNIEKNGGKLHHELGNNTNFYFHSIYVLNHGFYSCLFKILP